MPQPQPGDYDYVEELTPEQIEAAQSEGKVRQAEYDKKIAAAEASLGGRPAWASKNNLTPELANDGSLQYRTADGKFYTSTGNFVGQLKYEAPPSSSSQYTNFGVDFFSLAKTAALSFLLPGVGSAIAESLIAEGIVTSQVAANVIGNVIANTTASVAQGQPFDKALTNSLVNAAVNTGSVEVAKEVNKFVTSKAVTDAIVSAGGSAVKTAAAGGTEEDIARNMGAALAGSAASSAYQSAGDDYTRSTGRLIGSTVAGYITGGPTGAITGAVNELGSQSKGKVAGTIEDTFRNTTDTKALPASQVAAMTTETDAGPAALNQVDVTGKALPTDITSTNIIDTIARTTPTASVPAVTSPTAALNQVEIAAKKPDEITDTDVINAITAEKKPDAVLQDVEIRRKALPTDITKTDIIEEPAKLQDVTVTGKREEPPSLPPVTITGKRDGELEPVTITGKRDGELDPVTITGKADEPAATPEEKAPEEKPYKPDLFILSGKKPKAPPTKSSDSVLGQALGTTTGLTASRGAGEIEDPSTGKKKRKVWNEETLRLKDALGV